MRITGRNPVQIARRRAGGLQVMQGSSYILLSADEARELIEALQELLDEDGPRAEKMSRSGDL